MAIVTDDTIDKFGTQDAVDDGSTAALTDTSVSVTADITSWVNDDDAPRAKLVLTWQYASGTIDAGGHVNLFYSKNNILSTSDENVPAAGNLKHFVGTFVVDENLSTATDELIAITIELKNWVTSSSYDFAIENRTGVTMAANWDIDITPLTVGPHA
ncbi:MAG: hypothetical protein V3T88_07450 [Nitrosomonadaceae bacterium]